MDSRIKKSLRDRPQATMEAAIDEIGKFVEKKGFRGVHYRDLPPTIASSIIPSMMFITDKYLPDGSYEKTKARLVGGGHKQIRDPDEDLYSPTMTSFALFTIATIAAHEHRVVEAWDIGSAYLNAKARSDKPIYMRLDAICSGILSMIDPSFTQFLRDDGTMIVEVLVAIYGCIDSAKLWNDELHSSLITNGFTRNPVEPCVYNKISPKGQTTLGIYVDDIFATSHSQNELDQCYDLLLGRYNKVNRRAGAIIPFLGMTFDYTRRDIVSINMSGYIDDLLRTSGVEGCAPSPATGTLFEVHADMQPLSRERHAWFYSLVFKCLYLTERIRPDAKVAVAFLTTRARDPTIDDEMKLIRLIKYIRQTKHACLVLRGNYPLCFAAYIDASYGVHPDAKSHSGLVLTLGGGSIFARSVKQKINTKSSTEAELVAVSDQCSMVIHARSFLCAQGSSPSPIPVYQDNMSTLNLIKRGTSTSDHTRHISIRTFWISDRIQTNELIFQHLPTADMIADILTKPLQGKQLTKLRTLILGAEV
jgi:hypothetical protein